ncbi:MAG: hypothetical protein WC720_05080 [Candidatus Shapirobacteria bacterium]|jgi:hypothetical protein
MAVLTIDNYEIELGNSRLVFSKSGYSFEDWLTKDITYSERITLPESGLLNQIFFRPFSSEITGKKFSKFHNFKYKDNGKIVFSGICKLLKFNENRQYEIQLLDSSFELFENLNGKLNKLDLESFDFVFNSTAYNTLKVINSGVWIWPASSTHQEKILANNILSGNLAYSRPFFSAKRLIEKMFSVNGWSYELESNTSLFDKIIISTKDKFCFTSFEKSFTGTLTASSFNLASPVFLKTDTLTGNYALNLTYKSKIRIRGYANAENDMLLTITGTGAKPQTQTFFLNKGLIDYDITSNDFQAGTAITISFSGTGNLVLENFLIYTLIDENNFGAMSSAIFIDFKVKTYDNIPGIDQKDLFKHCLVKIGGYFSTNNFNKKLTINSVKSLSKLNAIDWSEKFIEESENIIPLDGYGKVNYFSYDNSKDSPDNLGRGTFEIDNETLQESKDVYKSIFAASAEVTITDKMIDNSMYDDTERVNEINTLIGYYEEIGAYTVARFENLNGNNLLSNYYSNFVKAIQRGEIIECKVNLNKSDFFLFDFTKLVYIKQKKSIYYVLNIGNYIENELTDIRLLKS